MFGGFIHAQGQAPAVNNEQPEPGSTKGYQPSAFGKTSGLNDGQGSSMTG
jgi:hypothetical protein